MYASPLNFLESLLVKSCDAAVDKFTVLEFSAHPKPVTIFFGSIPQLACYRRKLVHPKAFNNVSERETRFDVQ
jgi:hypothetical protein